RAPAQAQLRVLRLLRLRRRIGDPPRHRRTVLMEASMYKRTCILAALAGCNLLEPRVADQTIDAPPGPKPIDAAIDVPPGPRFVLPPGSIVPPVSDDAELTSQIRIFD